MNRTDQKTHDGLRITDHKNFSKESFGFGNTIKYSRFDAGKTRLLSAKGKTLLLRIPNCLSFGVKKSTKYKKMEFTLPISLDEEFISIFDMIGERCYTHVKNSDGNAMTCLSKNGKSPVLYVKLDDETVFFDENGEPIGHREYRDLWFRSDAVVMIESVYAADDVISVQMKLHE
ncbi:Hypothetical predicted protein, partial [Paramuricea clavata]